MSLPRSVRRRSAHLLALLAVAASTLAGPASASAAPAVDGRERAVIERINDVRAKYGVAPLTLSPRISRSADRHSQRMARARIVAHRLRGEARLRSRLRWAVGDAKVGEVLLFARGGVRSSRIVRAWMDSPGHRRVLLSPSFRVAGVGIREVAGGIFATVDVAAGER